MTPQQIILGAYGRSKLNNPGKIATESTELLGRVNQALTRCFRFAARINPEFFGKEDAVAFAASGWARPADAELVFWIEKDGAQVIVVPRWDRKADTGRPAVYRMGQQYKSAGNPSDPTAGSLTFCYARRPAAAGSLGATLDSAWPDAFAPLLELELAMFLALKDGRGDEMAVLKVDRDAHAQEFMTFLEHETVGEVRRFERTLHLPPAGAALIGGASL